MKRRISINRHLAAALTCALIWAPGLPHADADRGWGDPRGHEHGHDHDRARAARARGEILPIAEILRRVAAQVPGEVIEVELEHGRHRGEERWIYEIQVLSADGRLFEVEVDAARGDLLKLEDD